MVGTASMSKRLLDRAEYEALIARGVLDRARIELLDGELVSMSPQHEPHASVVERLTAILYRQLGDGVRIRCQLPLVLGERSVPEPDLVVAPLQPSGVHPTTAHLVVEITDSTLERDLEKAGLYARAGLPVYWLFDLPRGEVRVHGDPVGGVYRSVTIHRRGDVLRVDALPALAAALSALLD